MPFGFVPLHNSFHETLLGLEYSAELTADIFSQACVESFAAANLGEFGYVFTQVFEPDVLREIALLEGVPYESLARLTMQPTPTMRRLAELAGDVGALRVVELVNVASALISISRFEVAADTLAAAAVRARTSRERFEIAWLAFLISNRRDDGRDSSTAFTAMRVEIDGGQIPRGRILDACTQAVVWYLKRREVPEYHFSWSVETGHRLIEGHARLDAGTVSSWYRGIAMLPATLGASGTTREYMQRARNAAEDKLAESPGAYEKNMLKTYYESSLKEHMYLTRDLDLAEEAGQALIALDPVWGPSYGELAEAYEKFGQRLQAAVLYEQAAAAGPPYVGHHLLRAARCRESLDQPDAALDHYSALLEIAPGSSPLRDAGSALADQASPKSRQRFELAAGSARRLHPGESL